MSVFYQKYFLRYEKSVFKKWLNVIRIFGFTVIFIYIISKCFDFFQGISSFEITTVCYALICYLFFIISKKFKFQENRYFIVVTSVIFSLFISEVILRFIIKYPLTYSERQWGEYFSMYERFGSIKRVFNFQQLTKENNFEPFQTLTYRTPEFSYPTERANRLGLRGSLPTNQKQIIVALGDSFTESFAAPADSTYPLLLEQIFPEVESVKVVNAGISGSDPFHEFELLKMISKNFKLETAIFMFNSSDINDVMTRGGKERFERDGFVQYKSGPWWEPIYAVSFVFRLVMHNCFYYDYSLMTPALKEQAQKKAINQIVSLVSNDILLWSKANKVGIKIILQPMYPEIRANSSQFSELKNAFTNANIDFLDLSECIQLYSNPLDLYWAGDGHFNSTGYCLVAKCVYNYCK